MTPFELLFLQTFLHIKRQYQKDKEGPRLTKEQKAAILAPKVEKPYKPLTYVPILPQWIDEAEHPICVNIKQAIRASIKKPARLRAV